MGTLKINNEENCDGIIYFELEGSLDAHNFEHVETLFTKYIDTYIYRFVVDVSGIEKISSTGAGVFISAAGTCQENGGNVFLVKPSQEVKDIFGLLGVLQIFPVVGSRALAFDLFQKKAV